MKLSSLTWGVLAIVILACGKASAQADPCQSSAVEKKSVLVNTMTAGEAQLIPASPQTIHVCGFLVDANAGFAFTYGSGVGCSVNRFLLTPFFLVVNAPHAYSGPGTIFSVPADNNLCVIQGGPGSVVGVLTYARR